ncbi:hypothetical protein C1N62_21985 (plasmid) [Nissabacter sp. SGAir0207]|nr:hypothetical protein C1N62_21985 [Nissabacter sp. SGAir0207]
MPQLFTDIGKMLLPLGNAVVCRVSQSAGMQAVVVHTLFQRAVIAQKEDARCPRLAANWMAIEPELN